MLFAFMSKCCLVDLLTADGDICWLCVEQMRADKWADVDDVVVVVVV